MQHAEHYSRLLNERQDRNSEKNGSIKTNGKEVSNVEETVETLDPAKAIEEANS